jgi:hypothetical protein
MIAPHSYFWSKYHKHFVSLGYPELDVVKWQDGEWAIIQVLGSPAIPAFAKWEYVLTGLRNIEPTIGFFARYTRQLDITKKEFWDREEAKTKAMEEERAAAERAAQLRVDKAHEAIINNPDLMERIAKNGLQEMDINRIGRHVPSRKFGITRRIYG